MILYSSAGVGAVVLVVVFDYAASSMTTENGKREGRNWPEMTSSGGSVGKLGRTFVRFWGPAKRSCRPRLFSIPGQNLGQLHKT
ncbi:hypothetical protein T05_2592 [Trichinella murrelli]|uniref:Uncharacterized protein n=1 Tax=Trichinella murrelli TaxID=144512 RepID=A0A0V0U3Y6_9BILA|nr:hypothetical protein T05_2592 [Trichinella murrelli]